MRYIMKKRTVSIITIFSIILALFVPLNISASEDLYDEEEDIQYVASEQACEICDGGINTQRTATPKRDSRPKSF